MELGKELGIPKEIIEKAPSAGLWEGQTDEGEMGISYQEIDTYIRLGIAKPDVIARIREAYYKTAHKRQLPYSYGTIDSPVLATL